MIKMHHTKFPKNEYNIVFVKVGVLTFPGEADVLLTMCLLFVSRSSKKGKPEEHEPWKT